MVTVGEILRWMLYTLGDLYRRLAIRLLRRDALLSGSEHRFRVLLESAPDAIVIVNSHGHITLVNAQTERLFGWPRDALVGQNITELIPERFRSRHREHQKAYLRSGQTRAMGSGLELYGRRRDGTEFPVEVSLSPLRTDEGVLVSSVIRDVTERKRIEDELRDRAEALQRSNDDLEQFAYVASHDLSAPLRIVGGFVGLLARRYSGQLDAEADEFVAQAVGGVERMQALIDDLLEYSRVGRQELRPKPVDCGRTVSDVLETLKPQIEKGNVRVSVGELPTVWGEPRQLGQLFQNVIDNAVKFSRRDHARVDVSATRENGMWSVAVRDNGIGIDPAHADQMFHMFERLHTDEHYPGTGIGLAICKRIVEHHRGRIAATPAPGGGTVVTITLPAADGRQG